MKCETAKIGTIAIGPGEPLALIGGPCVIESREHTLHLAEAIRDICKKIEIPLIFKASFDKANRSSIQSYRGPGLSDGLAILAQVRSDVGGCSRCRAWERPRGTRLWP